MQPFDGNSFESNKVLCQSLSSTNWIFWSRFKLDSRQDSGEVIKSLGEYRIIL